MNPRPLETAVDADLRLSTRAIRRAALRARQVAQQTGTALVISRQGVLELVHAPASLPLAQEMQETLGAYGKRG